MSEEKISLWTCCICQIYGITLYRAAWADESSSHPAGFHIHLSAQTFCFLPHMCCALKQTRQKYVMWKVCLLKCASLIMVFPSISVSPHPLHPSPPPFHEDLTSLGRDVLPLKLHGEFCFSPPWLPRQHATVYSATAHRLLYLSFVSWYIFNTFRRVCAVIPQGGKTKEECFLFSHLFCALFGCVFCRPFNFSVYVELLQ